ncbi:MAG: hypothetical protein K8M05_37220 [Deltaproteobacteria bacterium]|nr:hypothetical protein [Kofleriaceae bacterium]
MESQNSQSESLPAMAGVVALGGAPIAPHESGANITRGAPTDAPGSDPPPPDGEVNAASPDVDAEVPLDETESGRSYILSDVYDNAEYAIRAAIDPPQEGKPYVRHGLRPRLTLGDYWQCRPRVSIEKFDDQPRTATEIRDRFGDDLGRIMTRVPSASPRLARAHLGDSLRPFDDHSLHIDSAISLCVYASGEGAEHTVTPPILGPMERACVFDTVDYLAMRCHQLDQRATLAKSVADARAVRTDLGALETLARKSFRAGELNDAALAACERLRLGTHIQEARDKAALAAEAATERSGDQAARFNVALTVVFGIVGAAGLTDSLTKPLWTKFGLPMPEGYEGPLCFVISAVLVGFILALVARVLNARAS